jgi:glycosyltransferase involved in cell wall biosynthesis
MPFEYIDRGTLSGSGKPLRVAVVADLLEERWPSMDLVADMLVSELRAGDRADALDVEMLRPTLGRGSHVVKASSSPERAVDRFLHRFWDYSLWLRSKARSFDVFHIVDHSYAHLAHVLPAHRTIVTCHDVDAFLPLVDPALATSRLPTVLTRLIRSGMRKAACVTCDSHATREDVCQYNLVTPDKLVVVHNGTHVSFSSRASFASDHSIDRMLDGRAGDAIELLHVGTTIPRKRIDVLLQVLAAVRGVEPRAKLVKAGGRLTEEQRQLAQRLGVDHAIVELPFLETEQLAALYRRAAAVLVTSDREGFGLPVAEAMACGTPVVASDLPVLREVGGPAGLYCAIGDIPAWREGVLQILAERNNPQARIERRTAGFEHARPYTWSAYASSMRRIYEQVSLIAHEHETEGRRVAV